MNKQTKSFELQSFRMKRMKGDGIIGIIKKTKSFTILLTTLFASSALANVVGGETQNFNPTSNGSGFITVQSSQPLPKWTMNLGLFINHAINTLPIFKTIDGEQTRSIYHDSVTGAHIHAGYGVTNEFELGISLPYVIGQTVTSVENFQGEFTATGITAISVNSKYRVWKSALSGVALIGSVNVNRLENSPFSGDGSGPTINLEVAADTKMGKNLLALNIGHRWRSPGEPLDLANNPIRPLKNQLIMSTAANFGLTKRQSVILELFGSIPTQSSPDESDRLESSAEVILGYKHLVHKDQVALNFGAGSELIHGHSSPDWRLFAGVNWTFGVKKEKKPEPIIEKPSSFIEGPLGPLGPIKPIEVISVNDVLFGFNSNKLILKGQNTSIFKLAKHLNRKPVYRKLIILGHTDSVGSSKYNKKLSKQRAETLRKWLINNYDLDPKKITAVGQGEAYPIASNKTERGRQKNRRVEFKIFRENKK